MAQNYKNAFLTNITTLPSSGDTLTLGDSQIGIFKKSILIEAFWCTWKMLYCKWDLQ